MSAKSNREQMWGPNAGRFVAVPFPLLMHYKDLGLNEIDYIVCSWIIFHQWNEKATFVHPNGLAEVLKVNYDQAVSRLKSLQRRGFLVLEPTISNKTNYYQDLRPLRNKLRVLLEKKLEGIDISINSSSLTDASILDSISKDVEIIDSNDKDASIDASRRHNVKSCPESIDDILEDFRNINS